MIVLPRVLICLACITFSVHHHRYLEIISDRCEKVVGTDVVTDVPIEHHIDVRVSEVDFVPQTKREHESSRVLSSDAASTGLEREPSAGPSSELILHVEPLPPQSESNFDIEEQTRFAGMSDTGHCYGVRNTFIEISDQSAYEAANSDCAFFEFWTDDRADVVYSTYPNEAKPKPSSSA